MNIIFASMEGNSRKHPDKQSDILDWSKGQGTTVPKRIDIWGSQPPVGLALERLSEIFRTGINDKMLFVKFEDLCLYPDSQMQRIYQYLEIPHFQHNFEYIPQITIEDDTVHGIYGDHTIRNTLKMLPDDSRDVLGDFTYEWIYENFKCYFDIFGYKK